MDAILNAPQVTESELRAQRDRVSELKRRLAEHDGPIVDDLSSVVDHLVRRSVWIVGGDGWAYDIGSGGVDHVLASGRNVNILVLDTEVYSNTGGQMSKSTPLGAVAKFAASGKQVAKKDLALQAISYGNVYVARVAMGADPQQTLEAFREAEAYDGTSLIIAYSHCIAHGIELRNGLDQQHRAVASGYWPLVRYDPIARAAGRQSVPARFAPAADQTDRLHLPGTALPLAGEHRSGGGRTTAGAGAAVGRPTLGGLRGNGHPWRASIPGRPPPGAVTWT